MVVNKRKELSKYDLTGTNFYLQIDENNVKLLTDSQLKELGVSALGDRMLLRDCFCKSCEKTEVSREEKLEKMRLAIEQTGATRLSKRSGKEVARDDTIIKKAKRPEKETLKFQFGWKHWDGKKYVQKKLNQGGGNRQFEVPRNASLEDCKKIALGFFFPGGESYEGKQTSMAFEIGNFKGDIIDDSFIASEYRRSSGLTVPRLYLLSKEVDDDQQEEELSSLAFDDDFPQLIDDDCLDDIESIMESQDIVTDLISDSEHSAPSSPDPLPIIDLSSLDQSNNRSTTSSLIGTSKEREIFSQELEYLVAESEEIDKKKAESATSKEKEKAQLQELKRRRGLRVTPEPQKGENTLSVCVRHPSLGRIVRRFLDTSKMEEVYDWVGSLCITPRYFSLSIYPGDPIYPSENVEHIAGHVLSMVEEKSPLPLSRDDSVVSFFDGSERSNCTDDTLPLSDNPITSATHLQPDDICGDDFLFLEDEKKASLYKQLVDLAEQEKEKLKGSRIVRTTRNTVYQDLLLEYENEELTTRHIVPMFYDETGCGDGVLREMYSIFWETFFKENCDGSSQFSIRLLPQMTDKYKIIGRIITHQFIQCSSFPVQLARASIDQALFGNVSEECLIDTFLKMLPLKESEMLSRTLEGRENPFPTDDVVDILDEYNIRTFPSQSNVKELIKSVASLELVSRPYLALANIKEGMGPFWAEVSKEMIDALYSLCEPTHSRVVTSLSFQPSTPQENRVFRWLRKYLMESDIRTVTKFLQFCTGSAIIEPARPIALELEVMPQVAMRPTAKTCFRILSLPCNYLSYLQLKENLDLFLVKGAWDLRDY